MSVVLPAYNEEPNIEKTIRTVAGYLDGKAIDAKEVAKLADLESREVLLGKLAGAMLASLQNAVYLFQAPLAQAARLAGALQAKAEQDPSILAGGAGVPAAAEEAPAADAVEAPSDEVTEAPADETTEAPAEDSAAVAEEAPAEEAAAASDESDTAEA
jgi:large subunit ribosomal protein L10